MMGPRYKTVNLSTPKSLGSPNCCVQIDGDRATGFRYLSPRESNECNTVIQVMTTTGQSGKRPPAAERGRDTILKDFENCHLNP
jgi:hypothetical protein